MSIIPTFFRDSVVALGVKNINGEDAWIGTGFLVARKDDKDATMGTVYLITNKHVVKDHSILFSHFNYDESLGGEDLILPLVDSDGKKKYSEHPNEQVDVIAIQINPDVIKERKLKLRFILLEDHSLTLSEMEKTGVEEGALVYAMGFPMNLMEKSVNSPICRLGCISRVADAFVNPDTTNLFLVDTQVFPGNSGGPIVSRPEMISINCTPVNTNARLIGILSAYIPYQEILYSKQTGHLRMVQEENSGLTIVHPVDRIKEVVELEYRRNLKTNIGTM